MLLDENIEVVYPNKFINDYSYIDLRINNQIILK